MDSCNKSIFSLKNGFVYMKRGVVFGAGCRVSVNDGGELYLGQNVWFTGNSLLIIRKKCTIGNSVACSWNVTIMDHDAHCIEYADRISAPNKNDGVKIGDNVWIGFGSSILKNACMGSVCVVSANSFVNKKFGNHLLIGGVPAKAIRRVERWGGECR